MTDFVISTIDRQSKRTTMRVGVIDAATNPELQAIVDAIDAVILGSDASGTKTVPTVIDVGSADPPANKNADRKNKWLLRFQDSAGNILTHEIGTADNSQLPSSTDDYLDLAAGVGLALKTAFDAVYQSPYGNTGTLISVQQVNRGD
jgi:hypothetical protein